MIRFFGGLMLPITFLVNHFLCRFSRVQPITSYFLSCESGVEIIGPSESGTASMVYPFGEIEYKRSPMQVQPAEEDSQCMLCLGDKESISHLFLSCPVGWRF